MPSPLLNMSNINLYIRNYYMKNKKKKLSVDKYFLEFLLISILVFIFNLIGQKFDILIIFSRIVASSRQIHFQHENIFLCKTMEVKLVENQAPLLSDLLCSIYS